MLLNSGQAIEIIDGNNNLLLRSRFLARALSHVNDINFDGHQAIKAISKPIATLVFRDRPPDNAEGDLPFCVGDQATSRYRVHADKED